MPSEEQETSGERPIGNANCDMPECVGTPEDDTYACRGPSDELLELCESCLDDGWGQTVTLLEGNDD